MLTEQEIQQALRASRVMPLDVANPHGPLGLEQLAATVAQIAELNCQDSCLRTNARQEPTHALRTLH